MSFGGLVKASALVIVLLLTAVSALASVAGPASVLAAPPGVDPTLPLGEGKVRTDKNCYLPGQMITITLKNVGKLPLLYSSVPDFEVESETIGTVRMVRDWQRGGFRLDPGASMTWTWNQKWRAWDANGHELNKGMFVPRGAYIVLAEALVGVEIPDIVEIARSRFSIGDCLAQITAGDDIVAAEGQEFRFSPRIQITGDATISSVTWDLDPTVDANGDGNFTNDIDLAGRTPSYTFGDDGVFTVTMNVRGFGKISGMDRPAQDTIFTIDSSDSMQARDPLEYRKISVKDYVDWMVPADRGAVVDFDSVGRLVNGDHLSTNYGKIKSNVDTIDSSGGVFLSAGLFVSLYELRDYGDKSHKWIMIFLTGAETEDPRDPFYIPRAIDFAKDLGVTIYTVGLNIIEGDKIQLMKKIASDTGGRYFSAATTSNLRQIFDDLSADANTSQGFYFTVSDALSVTVGNLPPLLSIDPNAPTDVSIEAVLPANVSDPGSDDVTLTWDWGDGRSDTRTFFNDGVGPDPFPSPWGSPTSFVDVGRHVYRLSGDYTVTLRATDDDGGTAATSVVIHVSSSSDLKHEAIQRLKALKDQALARGDKTFVRALDESEEAVWESLGFKEPFRPTSVAARPGVDVTARSRDHDKVRLALGPSWDGRLASYKSLRIAWSNGVVTVIDLPQGWSTKDREFHVTPWVDSWHQDVRVHTERERKNRPMTLDVRTHEASLNFALSFDGDLVSQLVFTYSMRHLWVDATHLDPKHGERVFDEERHAVRELLCGGEGDDGEDDDSHGNPGALGDDDHDHEGCAGDGDDHDDDDCDDDSTSGIGIRDDYDCDDDRAAAMPGCALDPRMWTDTERADLDRECDAIANLLVKADEMLALVALEDAQNAPIQNPNHAKDVQHEIEKAEKELTKASSEWDRRAYADAISHFGEAWEHAQEAIEEAAKL